MKTDKAYFLAKQDIPLPAYPTTICVREGERVRPSEVVSYGISRKMLNKDERFEKCVMDNCSCKLGAERSFKYISEEDVASTSLASNGIDAKQEILHVTHYECRECKGYFRTVTK